MVPQERKSPKTLRERGILEDGAADAVGIVFALTHAGKTRGRVEQKFAAASRRIFESHV
jgi:hypothetical protein